MTDLMDFGPSPRRRGNLKRYGMPMAHPRAIPAQEPVQKSNLIYLLDLMGWLEFSAG